MSNWFDVSDQALRAAQVLKDGGHVRACLSRIYYSVYSQIAGHLHAEGHATSRRGRSNPAHDQLLSLATNNLRATKNFDRRRAVSRGLRTIWRLRIAADYDPESALGESDAVLALREAGNIERQLRAQN